MDVELTKASSRGQIVIPQDLREEMNVKEGTLFAVFGSGDTIILKKIKTPTKEKLIKDLEEIAKKGRKRAEQLGLKESDVPNVVHRFRRK